MTIEEALKKYWGYSAFRPRQETIVRAILEGRDVAVIMPTGGGKSLCYQLPAVVMRQTCVVVSPLIALMQDQAAQLEQAGIPAAFLNSTLDWGGRMGVEHDAERGALRLLYMSPERLVRPDTISWLKTIPIGFFAIDEAHCISEWGHEFRPEYRQLRILRDEFPDKPIAAFTASATRAVRHDIVAQLRLNDPAKVVASFHRPNLRYVVRQSTPKDHQRQLRAAIKHYGESSIIVYAPTIKGVESTAAWLESVGIPAIAYHGQMPNDLRARNQETWMEGRKQVMVGTLAFGLGINKPDVRAVIHLAMPKSLEQYYQEAGRAGRDGDEADCVLLWQRRDIGLLAHFIEQVADDHERELSWRRYHTIKKYVESDACRHRQICLHFGETPKWETCNACDVCGYEPAWLTAIPESLPTTTKRPQTSARYAQSVDTGLREKLREWRRQKAKALHVPPYVILHDTSIDALSSAEPRTLGELLEIPGIGERKADRYGGEILAIINSI